MENRIKRLAFEENRAHKLTDLASAKAGKLLKARERNEQRMQQKSALRSSKLE